MSSTSSYHTSCNTDPRKCAAQVSLYQLLKDPTEKNIEAHKSSLHEIIKISKERQLRVAPGINAELACMLSKDNEGIPESLYAQELKLYPESKIFIERLNNKKK